LRERRGRRPRGKRERPEPGAVRSDFLVADAVLTNRSARQQIPVDSEKNREFSAFLRRTFAVIEGGEKVRKTGFEIIFAQLMAKESAGDRRTAKTRDRYQRFAFAHQGPDGVLLRYAETEFTRAFSADWRQGRESKGQGDAEPGSSQAPVDLGEEDVEALKAMKP
jgi:hypothetical protein